MHIARLVQLVYQTGAKPVSSGAPPIVMELGRPYPSDPIERRRLSDEVKVRLESMISSGELAPGDIVPSERELMQRFGVGRPAIREALYALQKMGLLAPTSGTRPRVTTPTADRLIFELSGAVRFFLASKEGERAFQGGAHVL